MASNGRVGLRSGSPSFLVVGLSLVIVVLLYSYWSVSSRNSMLLRDQSFLQDRLRSLTSQKLAAEKKKTSFMTQLVDMEKKKRYLEGNAASASKEKTELNSRIHALEESLEQEKKKAASIHSQQSKSQAELQKLKGEIDQTTEKLKQLTNKANSFVEMYKNLKETLAKKHDELFRLKNEWHLCNVKLNKFKEEHPGPRADADDKNKAELSKGKGILKQGLANLKKQMQLTSTRPSSQPKAMPGPDPEKQEVVGTKVANETTKIKLPTGKLPTVAPRNQSDNNTNKAASSNNTTTTTATTTAAAVSSTGATNTSIISTDKQVEHKENKHKITVENQDDNNPENKQLNLVDKSKGESKEKKNEGGAKNDNLPVGPRAQPLDLEFPKRSASDREQRRLK